MPDENDEIKIAKDSMSVVTEIMKAAGKNENVKEASNNLGKTAVIVTNTINNALLPLVAINATFEKAKKYFAEDFQNDISNKVQDIDEENLVEPKSSIAGPAMQALTYAHEEPSLKDMYISLLASAMNKENADEAHPSFVEIIRQLSAEEAKELKFFLDNSARAICELHAKNEKDNSFDVVYRHFLDICDENTKLPISNKTFPVMIDNWIRLGLVTVDYIVQLNRDNAYSWVEEREEFIELSQKCASVEKEAIYKKGIIEATSFGKQFAKIVGILE